MKRHSASLYVLVRNEAGFSLTELMVAMTAFILVIASSASVFVPLLNQSKQQSKITETQIEGLIGLDILRRDVQNAGYGLPWELGGAVYGEAASDPSTTPNPVSFNDVGAPRGIISGDDANTAVNNSDYLVIKSAAVATNDAAHKWTYIVRTDPLTPPRKWGNPDEDLKNGDRVIVIRPIPSETRLKELVVSGTFFTTFNDVNFNPNFSPVDLDEKFLIFGIDGNTDPARPFNRADYYIDRPANMPQRCAQGTGVLVKKVLNQTVDGLRGTGLPLLDCVADFQVRYVRYQYNELTGAYDIRTELDDISGLTLDEIRNEIRNVEIFILAHEGQRDPYYTYPPANNPITVGINLVDLSTFAGAEWMNYRWKVYTLIIKAENLG